MRICTPFFIAKRQRSLLIKEAAHLSAAAGMLQLPKRLRLDLADTFTRHAELLADFFQRVIGVHADAEAHAQHTLLTRRKRCQHASHSFLEVRSEEHTSELQSLMR